MYDIELLAGIETVGFSDSQFCLEVQTLYRAAGDTDLFSDMVLVRKFHPVDIMLVCIGDRFTMGPARAAEAVRLVEPKIAVPMHYGTFPFLTGTPEEFAKELVKVGMGASMKKMTVGETMVWEKP